MPVYNPSGAGNVHIDRALTQISVGWPNSQNMAGAALFPSVGVQKQTDKYYIFGREGWLPENDYRAPGAAANEVTGAALSTDTYYAQEHSLQIAVTDEERENADPPIAPDRDGTNIITSKIMLGRERVMQVLATTAANYATSGSTNTVTLSGTSQWSDYANSDPISDLRTGKIVVNSRIFADPNVAVIPYQVMVKLEDHPDFLERIKYSERAIFSPELLASVLGFDRVVVPGVGINSANLGQTPTLGYLWGKDVVLAYVPSSPGLKIPAYGYEFTWGGAGGGQAQYVDRWREDRRKSDVIRLCRYYDVKLTAMGDAGSSDANKSIAGYLIKAAVA
jgi:hypothetical protein